MSYSHRDLTIKFAFSAIFYIVLYLIVGFFSIAVMFMFAVYHRVVARPPEGQEIAPPRFFSYFQLTIPSPYEGVWKYALPPIMVVDGLIAVVITGRILEWEFPLYDCEFTKREECILTIFDLVKDDMANISVNYENLRKGRFGIAMIVSGGYLLVIALRVLIPDNSNQRRVHESPYDGNIWEYFKWKRSNMIYGSIWMIFLCLSIVNFSFSDIFGDYIWDAIVIMKLSGLIIDYAYEKSLKQNLLISPMSITYGITVGLVTFGADDFLDFIDAYFIEFGMMLFERCYLGDLSGIGFEYVETTIPNLVKKLYKFILSEDDENVFAKTDDFSASSNSVVEFSDNDSLVEEANNSDSVNLNDYEVLIHRDAVHSSHSSELFQEKEQAGKAMARDISRRSKTSVINSDSYAEE